MTTAHCLPAFTCPRNLTLHPLAKYSGPPSRTGVHLGDYYYLFGHILSIKELHDMYSDIVRI
jgi:hypothetical protein